MNRKTIAVAILLLWIAGFGWMMRRNSGGDANRRLTEAAIRIQPATFYYSVYYRGKKIGAASSAIDTLVAAIVSEEYYTGTYPSGDSLVDVSARLQSRMTRGLRLTNISIDLKREGRQSKFSAFVQNDTTLIEMEGPRSDSLSQHVIGLHGALLPPGLIGVAVILGDRANVGHKASFVVFNPMERKPERREVRVLAESLFTVVDSAERSSADQWKVAHSDTVRAWKLADPSGSLIVWVDADGRVVEGSNGNGLTLSRTAFELAFDRAKTR
jgi:hypothetical protein